MFYSYKMHEKKKDKVIKEDPKVYTFEKVDTKWIKTTNVEFIPFLRNSKLDGNWL